MIFVYRVFFCVQLETNLLVSYLKMHSTSKHHNRERLVLVPDSLLMYISYVSNTLDYYIKDIQ